MCQSSEQQHHHSVSRRNFLTLLAGGSAAILAGIAPNVVYASGEGTDLTAEQALQKMVDGNKRYVAANATHPDQTADRRIEVAKGQKPFAVILTCSDSRVAPELLFDQGLGDLFVLRTAGNVLADVVVGSIEYAVSELKVPLLVVLGHEKCGAVQAAVDMVTKGAKFPGKIQSLATAIGPAVQKVKDKTGDLVDNSVQQNAIMVAGQLQHAEPILAEAVADHHLMVVAGRYDLDEGAIKWLELEK